MDEFARIAHFFRPLAEGFPGSLSLTDDAALLTVPSDQELVVTTDAMVEGTHFLPSDTPQSIAARLLRSNLSDLAAMGASAFTYTLTTTLRANISEDWLGAFAKQLREDQTYYGCHLIGGDSLRTDGPLHLSITAMGLVPKGQALRRTIQRTSNPPYDVYVSGTIGDSFLGLQLSLGKTVTGLTAEDETFLLNRHFFPQPRLQLGKALRGHALAAVDISDGLVADLGHIARQSGMACQIDSRAVPHSDATTRALVDNPSLLAALITGGEDYELGFVLDKDSAVILSSLAEKNGISLSKIGALQSGVAGEIQVMDASSRALPLSYKGWTHF